MKKSVKAKIDEAEKKSEENSRKMILQELFNDFNKNRFQIYKLNLVRGIFFGFGSVLGGTVVIAILIWILSAVSSFIPPLSDFVEALNNVLQSSEQ
ncbi:hypothetical protein EOL96_07040 [Candidatus Saccharibacteria bacterium]|nr:hypothetical protein [Candidatus Saccharibacteria bacterium]